MKVLACVLLVLTVCSGENLQEKEDLFKRDLEHRNNLALLTSIHLGDDKSLNGLSPNPASVDDRNLPPEDNLQPYNLGNLPTIASAAPPPLTNDLFLTYAPAHPFSLPHIPIGSFQSFSNLPPTNFAQFPYETGTNLLSTIPQGVPQTISPQFQLTKEVPVPQHPINIVPQAPVPQQTYQIQLNKEVPQQHPVNIVRTLQVPVEVPKPYEVRVPHPVMVPVHIRVPVPVARPYPVQVTKTVAVPVEKPVYIRVPQPVEVPVPQPYPVGVPQPVHVRVPVLVRFAEGGGNGLSNLDGTEFVPSPSLINTPGALNNVAVSGARLNPGAVPSSVEEPCGSCDKVVPTTGRPVVSVAPNRQGFTGNGLLPPPPPTKVPHVKNVNGGLLGSYVGSKEGGVYRRSTKYQTAEYQKTW